MNYVPQRKIAFKIFLGNRTGPLKVLRVPGFFVIRGAPRNISDQRMEIAVQATLDSALAIHGRHVTASYVMTSYAASHGDSNAEEVLSPSEPLLNKAGFKFTR